MIPKVRSGVMLNGKQLRSEKSKGQTNPRLGQGQARPQPARPPLLGPARNMPAYLHVLHA